MLRKSARWVCVLAAAWLGFLCAVGSVARAQSDESDEEENAPPSFLTVGTNGVYFAIDAPAGGWQLWVTDGTALGTRLIRNGLGLDVELVSGGRGVYFSTRTGLFTTDGTAAGTVTIANLSFFATGLKPGLDGIVFGDGNGRLWTSAGQGTGVRLVANVDPHLEQHDLTPAALTWLPPFLFFRATAPEVGMELWRTDGHTIAPYDIKPGGPYAGSNPRYIVKYRGGLLFGADDGTGYELWRIPADSAAGAFLVRDINPTGESDPRNLTVWKDRVLFSADDGSGQELWSTDGTSAGTARVADINPNGGSYPNAFRFAPTAVLFRADDGVHGEELWRTDGTPGGTRLVKDVNPSAGSGLRNLLFLGTRLFFSADDGVHGEELWTSDGTAAGTVLVRDLNPNGSSMPKSLRRWDGKLFFTADDGEHGESLWVLHDCTNATSDGACRIDRIPLAAPPGSGMPEPFLVKDINPGPADGDPYDFVGFHGAAYFHATQDDAGAELWRSDGTPLGTFMVRDLEPGPGSSDPYELTPVGDTLFFTAHTSAHGAELWKTDGTADGTMLVADVRAGDWGSYPSGLTAVGDRVYFAADDGTHGAELWVSDGTAAGTRMVADRRAVGGSDPHNLTVVGGALYYTANVDNADGVGEVVMTTDGTDTGTISLSRLAENQGGPPSRLTALGDMLLFRAGGSLRRALGRVQQTGLLIDGRGYPRGVDHLITWNGQVFLAGNQRKLGRELWRTDGTTVTFVKDINPGPASSDPRRFTPVGDALLFVANDGVHGPEIWRTDGTADGTRMVRDIDPIDLSIPAYLAAGKDAVYFSAHTPSYGYELWRSDGTAAGTTLVKNINLARSSYPEDLVGVDGTVFFYADDGVHGDELWAVTRCGDGVVDPGEQCDDGNRDDGDDCPATCRYASGAAACSGGTRCLRGARLRLTDDGHTLRGVLSSAGPFVVPSGAGVPTLKGARLEIVNPATAEGLVIPLPETDWEATTRRGRAAFRYSRQGSTTDVRVDLGPGKLQVQFATPRATFTLDESRQRRLAVRLILGGGDRYCLRFGGRVQRDRGLHETRPGVFRATRSRAPSACS